MKNITTENFEDEINLIELLQVIWKKKFLIVTIITIGAFSSIYYALSLPNIYSSNALLAQSNPNESLGSKIGAYSSLAGMAGIQIPNDSGGRPQEAIARMKSYDFFIKEFLPFIEYENLLAAKFWDQTNNRIIYNDKLFISTDKRWVGKQSFNGSYKPSHQEAYAIYNRILNISKDKETLFVSLTIEHVSPFIAEKWLKIIIKNINNHMREIDRDQAESSIDFLNLSWQKTNITQIKEAISKLLEDQVQTLMLVESNEDYVFKLIVSPIAAETKSKPARSSIVLFGIFLSTIFSTLLALTLHYINFKKI